MTTIHSLEVPGATLHYEVRGSGPVLMLMGAPMGAAAFTGLAEAMADDFTVVTHDPRGIAGSRLADPTPDLRADDAAAILDALGAQSADAFGSSGGAVTGLALVTRHPGRVRTLVAHEPPVLTLLPDADQRLAEVDDIVATFHRDGLEAAWAAFMATSGLQEEPGGEPGGSDGVDGAGEAGPPDDEPSEQDLVDAARFFAHELRGTTAYLPDVEVLRSSSTQVIVGLGVESSGLLTSRTSRALTAGLRIQPLEFPGEHVGFLEHPDAFADVLRKALLP